MTFLEGWQWGFQLLIAQTELQIQKSYHFLQSLIFHLSNLCLHHRAVQYMQYFLKEKICQFYLSFILKLIQTLYSFSTASDFPKCSFSIWTEENTGKFSVSSLKTRRHSGNYVQQEQWCQHRRRAALSVQVTYSQPDKFQNISKRHTVLTMSFTLSIQGTVH